MYESQNSLEEESDRLLVAHILLFLKFVLIGKSLAQSNCGWVKCEKWVREKSKTRGTFKKCCCRVQTMCWARLLKCWVLKGSWWNVKTAKNGCAEFEASWRGECGSEKATSFWFLPGIFSRTSEATFSGDTEETRRNGWEVMVTLECERKRGEKLETKEVSRRISCFSFNKIWS